MTIAAPTQEPAGEANQRYDVFISYSRKDVGFVDRLERTLEAYKAPASLVPDRRRLEVFRDAQDLTGPDYNQSIRGFLRRSAKLLVVCSPQARQSIYVDQEIEWFLETHDSADVIALLLDGAPNNEVDAEDPRRAFPAQLCRAHAIPLAADYRGFDWQRNKVAKSPFEGPWYTLLANIYGIDRSTLEQRERQRQRRERRIVAAIAGSVMLGLATAAVFSWIQMRRAEEQRNVAVKGVARSLAMHSQLAAPLAPDTGLLLAIESARTTLDLDGTVTAEAQSALRNALSRAGGMRLDIGTRGLSFSADGHWLIQQEDQGATTVWDLTDDESRFPTAIRLPAELTILRAGPANRLLVVTKNPSRLGVLDLRKLEQPPRWLDPNIEPVNNMQFSADGSALLFVNRSADVMRWDLNDPTASPQPLSGHAVRRSGEKLEIKQVALSSTGRWLTGSGRENTLLLWDTTTPDAEPRQLLIDVAVGAQEFSADDRWLRVTSSPAAESWKTAHSLWYLGGAVPEPVAIEREPSPGEASAVSLTSSIAQRLMTGDRMIESVAGRTLIWKLSPPSARIERAIPGTLAAIDGSHVVTVARRGGDSKPEFVISLWDMDSSETAADVRVSSTVHSVRYSARGRVLVALTDANELWSWHLDEDHFDEKPRVYGSVIGNQLELSPSGRELVVGNWYDIARLWQLDNPSLDPVRLSDVEDDAELREKTSSGGGGLTPDGGLQQMLAFDDRSQRVAVPLDGGAFSIADLQHPHPAPVVIRMHEDGGAISAITFSPDGELVAAGDRELNVHVWRSSDLTKPIAALRVPEEHGLASSLAALEFSHSGKLLAASDAFGTVAVWDLSTAGAAPMTFTNHKGWVRSMEFSADDRTLLVAAADGKASVVPLSDPKAVRMLEGHAGEVRASFSAADRFIVTVGKDATVRVWSTQDAKAEPRILRGHNSPIITYAFIPQQQRLVTASAESLRVWDLANADLPPQIVLLQSQLGIITASQDGQWLAATDGAGDIQLRRMDALEQPPLHMPKLVQEMRQEAFALRFSPDDRWLAALTSGQGWVWRMRSDELMQLACEATGRNFEATEWEDYLGEMPYRFSCSQWGLGPNYLKDARKEAERTAIDHATKLFSRAKELVPDLPFDAATEAKRLGVAKVLKEGRDLARSGEPQAALIQLGRVREIDPAMNFDPERELEQLRQASELMIKANDLAHAGKIDAAVAIFREVLTLDPGRSEVNPDDPRVNLDPVKRANEIHAAALAAEAKKASAP